MNLVIFLLVLAVLVLAILVYRSRVNHVTLKTEKDADFAALKAYVLMERDALKAELADVRAKMPGNHHWADQVPVSQSAPNSTPPSPAS